MIEWLGGRKAARFASAALRDWLDAKLVAWGDQDDLPDGDRDKDGWDWNDINLFEIAIQELERIGEHPVSEAERLRLALQVITERLDPNEHAMLIGIAKAALQD